MISLKKLLKEGSYGSSILPLGKVNLITGKCPIFNIYDTYDGTAEIWKTSSYRMPSKSQPPVTHKIVFTSDKKPDKKKGERETFYHDQTRREFGTWELVDFARVKDMKKLAKYGKVLNGYTYK